MVPGLPSVIRLQLVLENAGDETATLEFVSAQRYDFEIRNQADEMVWRWSDCMGFAQLLGEERVLPDGLLRYQAVFTDTVPAGEYVIMGWVTGRQAFRDQRSIRVR